MPDDPYAHAPRLPEGERVDPRSLVRGGSDPIELEIGPGRGWFMVDRLEASPTVRMIGLEIRRKWATKVDERLRARGLSDRGRVFAEDARHALRRFPAACVSKVFLHFPDPWWKKRHAKRRLATNDLVDELARVLVEEGEVFVQSDVEDRVDQFRALLDADARFVPFEAGGRVSTNPYGARSPRERRVESDGVPVHRIRYRRRP